MSLGSHARKGTSENKSPYSRQYANTLKYFDTNPFPYFTSLVYKEVNLITTRKSGALILRRSLNKISYRKAFSI